MILSNSLFFNSEFCNGCPYNNCPHLDNKLKKAPIKSELNHSNTLLVFQSPGKDEWSGNNGTTERLPIISKSSHSAAARMRKSFARKNLSREDFDITEAVLCYPGQYGNGRDKKPRKNAVIKCNKHLEKMILNGNYSTIVSFGDIANRAVNKALENLKMPNIKHKISKHPCYRISNKDLDKSY